MISTRGSLPALTCSIAASVIALTCNAVNPGVNNPNRTPRNPNIGFASCNRCTAVSNFTSVSTSAPEVDRSAANATFTDRVVRSGRNSCNGGSSNLIVTGRPSISCRISTKSFRCNGNNAANAASRCSAVSARMSRSINDRRSPRNMCSVRHNPIPCAPSFRARFASSGVSAFARTPNRRRASACTSTRSTARTSSAVSSSAPARALSPSSM